MRTGTYALSKDFEALIADKRRKLDWRYAPIAAGTLFHVEVDPDFGCVVAWKVGSMRHAETVTNGRRSPAPSAFFDALVLQPDRPSWLVHREGLSATKLLDKLVAAGSLTMGDVRVAVGLTRDEP